MDMVLDKCTFQNSFTYFSATYTCSCIMLLARIVIASYSEVEARFRSVFPDYLEVATAVVVLRGVGKASSRRNSVDVFFILRSFRNIGF